MGEEEEEEEEEVVVFLLFVNRADCASASVRTVTFCVSPAKWAGSLLTAIDHESAVNQLKGNEERRRRAPRRRRGLCIHNLI